MSDEPRGTNRTGGAPHIPFDPIGNGQPSPQQRQRTPRPPSGDGGGDAPPPAPWEVTPNTYQPPVVNSGAKYAEYGTGPGSVTGISPANVFHDPAQEFTTEDPSGTARKIVAVFGIVVVLAIVGLLLFWIVPANVPAPTSYAKYVAPDGRFQCDAPAGWAVTSDGDRQSEAGDSPTGGALFKDSAAKIDITTSTVTELKGQILLSSGAALPPNFTADPTDSLFDLTKFRAKGPLAKYSETPVDGISTGFGDAKVAEFTGVGGLLGLGGPMHGYRACVSTEATTFVIVTQCPEKQWTTLQPAFQRVIQSMEPIPGTTPVDTPPAPLPGMGAPASSSPNPAGGTAYGYGGGDTPTTTPSANGDSSSQ